MASRLFYLLAGLVLAGLVPLNPFQLKTSDAPFGALNLWAHFDGEHYLSVAGDGYLEDLHLPGPQEPSHNPRRPRLTAPCTRRDRATEEMRVRHLSATYRRQTGAGRIFSPGRERN
ncbi:MAG: hypothetical protein M3122_05415 [Actinomycetota bacterium]|nr:hypothetical protein [Actinomycetota bacterium]